MPTRNINLTDHNEAYLSKMLDAGRFKNASEVVRAGLRLLEYQEEQEQAKIEALRNAFKEGKDAFDRGDSISIDSDEDLDRLFTEIDEEIGVAR